MSVDADRTSVIVLARRPQLLAFAVLSLAAWATWAGSAPRFAGWRRVVSDGTAARNTAASPVPQQLGPWVGTPVPVERRAIEILETDDVALMEYRLGDEPPVWFAQVAGFGNRAAFHPPELCYVGSHFEVLERAPVTVTVNGGTRRQVMRLLIAQDAQRFEAWYWFTANGRVTPNYYQQQVWLIADAMRRRPTSGTLVRISTPVDHIESAHRRLLAFVTAWDTAQAPPSAHGL